MALSRSEFGDALRKGLGRAILDLRGQRTFTDWHRREVLEACMTPDLPDAFQGSRDAYQIELVRQLGIQDELLDAIAMAWPSISERDDGLPRQMFLLLTHLGDDCGQRAWDLLNHWIRDARLPQPEILADWMRDVLEQHDFPRFRRLMQAVRPWFATVEQVYDAYDEAHYHLTPDQIATAFDCYPLDVLKELRWERKTKDAEMDRQASAQQSAEAERQEEEHRKQELLHALAQLQHNSSIQEQLSILNRVDFRDTFDGPPPEELALIVENAADRKLKKQATLVLGGFECEYNRNKVKRILRGSDLVDELSLRAGTLLAKNADDDDLAVLASRFAEIDSVMQWGEDRHDIECDFNNAAHENKSKSWCPILEWVIENTFCPTCRHYAYKGLHKTGMLSLSVHEEALTDAYQFIREWAHSVSVDGEQPGLQS